VARHSKYERERRSAETERVKQIEAAWMGSVPTATAKAFAESVAAARARGPEEKRPDMAPGKTYDDIKIPWDSKGPCRFIPLCSLPAYDLTAFAYPNSFAPGQSGRNIIDAPSLFWHQLSLSKQFVIKERHRISLRFDVNNPWKHYFFSRPNTTVDLRPLANPTTVAQTFGKITSTQGQFSGQGGQYYMHAIFKYEF
jgi:hypothetical protein